MSNRSLKELFPIFLGIFIIGCNQSSNSPDVVIRDVWSRQLNLGTTADTSEQMNTAYNDAVYLKIQNNGGVSDRLIGAQTDVCLVTEIHKSYIENDRMMMKKVSQGIAIPPGGSVELKPGSYHLMLMGVKRSLSASDSFAVQLKFEKSGIKTVYAKIKKF